MSDGKSTKGRGLTAPLAACAAASLIAFSAAAPEASAAESGIAKGEKTWEYDEVQHKGFKDLGNYVIELPDYTDASVQEQGIAIVNDRLDHGELPVPGCTAMAKLNKRGEVVFGRNMDLEISQDPAYVYRTTFGKYKNVCVTYSPGGYLPYEEVKKLEELDENWLSQLIYSACDCFNEKGLYIEVNQRTPYSRLTNYGVHSARGEKTRADGTPWKDLRVCLSAITQLVSQNCATVQEAVEFVKNSYDWYTPGLAPDDPLAHYTGWNFAFLIGDATGEFGLIEIAQDEIKYIPYQFGHGNFYITPRWRSIEPCGAGEGRLSTVSDVIGPVQTLDEAMDAMKPIMWKNETMWIGESYRAKDAAHPNPYNQIVFQDDKGNPQMDWRNEYVGLWPVMDDGRMLIPAQMYEEAKNSSYDPMIKKYFDDAIATGRLVVDDGSFTFNVEGEDYTLTELMANYTLPEVNADNLKKKVAISNEYARLMENEDVTWLNDDYNFEALKAAAYAKLHIRYDENGVFDPSCMSKYEKLRAFYGYGTEKDETPLRDDAHIWTTSLNVGVNCAQKEMKVRFWEDDNVIYHVKF